MSDDLIADTTPWQGFPHAAPRKWQDKARTRALQSIKRDEAGLISAVMGSGKSAVIAELCHSIDLDRGQICVITTPTIRLVEQLTETIGQRVPTRHIGQWYTGGKRIAPITIACMPSAEDLARTLQSRHKDCALWIADEAHKTECDQMHAAYDALEPTARIGFTATPFRATSDEALSLWEAMLLEYEPSDAIDDGVIVPPKLRTYDGTSEDVDEACAEMIAEAAAEEGPGMVNALTIDDPDKLGAEPFAEMLETHDVHAEAVHSHKSDGENDRILRRLKNGQLDCVVHVNQLAEGADFPWLRWLCLRRPVQSRTRFCQEVGRVLRAHGDKQYGLLLDVHDLFHQHGLSHEAILAGGASSDEADDANEAAEDVAEALDELREMEAGEVETERNKSTPIKALEPVRAWLRKTNLAFESVGAIDGKIESTHWRDDPMSDSQKRTITHKAPDVIAHAPDEHQPALAAAKRAAELGDLDKGEASDLLGIIFAIDGQGWPERADGLIDRR